MADNSHQAVVEDSHLMVDTEDCTVVGRTVADCSRQAHFLVLA